MNTNEIPGIIVSGMGWSAKTIPAQIDAIAKDFPQIRDCHPATINIVLQQKIPIVYYVKTTELITWKIPESGATETFAFESVWLRVEGGERIPAWVYRASGSKNNRKENHYEVLAKFIPGLMPGRAVTLEMRQC